MQWQMRKSGFRCSLKFKSVIKDNDREKKLESCYRSGQADALAGSPHDVFHILQRCSNMPLCGSCSSHCFICLFLRTCVPVGQGQLRWLPPILCARWWGGAGWARRKEVQWDNQSYCPPLVKNVNSVVPPKYNGGGHGPSHSVLYICILCLVFYVQMYIVPGPGILCVNMYIFTPRHIDCDRGPNGPLLLHPEPGFLSPPTVPRTRSRSSGGAHGHCTFVNIFTHDQPVDSFYPSNPRVSISSYPILMYRITCTCILLCFLGALAQAFFCRQPTQGSYWCLNKHLYLVSCILYICSLRSWRHQTDRQKMTYRQMGI